MTMTDTWESLFKERAIEEGRSAEYIKVCIDYAGKLHERNLPVIFDFLHLAYYLGCCSTKLQGIVANVESHYRTYKIRKKSGVTRKIEAPDVMLKKVQRWIYVNILCKDRSIPYCVHGFMPVLTEKGRVRGIMTNAIPHSGHDWLINMDLKDFFHTVTLDMVKSYFDSLGYEEEVSKTLTALCTLKSKLPQGAPTSPMLSNLIAIKMDAEMMAYCEKRGITYTRYADDLTFSGNYNVEMPDVKDLYDIIYKKGFVVNRRKTKIRYRGCKKDVTGLTVTDGVHVPKKYRKEVWRELYFCKKFGVYEHYNQMGTDKGLYQAWLRGRIMFIRQIDPACGNKMLSAFNELNWLV